MGMNGCRGKRSDILKVASILAGPNIESILPSMIKQF